VRAEPRPLAAARTWLIALFLASASSDLAAQVRPEGDPATWTAAREAARRRLDIARMTSLRARAEAANGLYVVRLEVSCNWGSATTIESLLRHSPVVIVGVLRSSQSVLSTDESAIHTVHDIEVAEGLSGGLSRGATIKVTMPGGRIDFGGGLAAEVRVAGEPIAADLPHLFFLRPVEPQAVSSHRNTLELGAFQPAIASFGGVYRLTSSVESLAGLDDPLRPAYQDILPPLFLAAVRQAVATAGKHP
jgi:hypothetical protein